MKCHTKECVLCGIASENLVKSIDYGSDLIRFKSENVLQTLPIQLLKIMKYIVRQ